MLVISMKHIGACLDGIQIALAQIPRKVESAEDKAKAFKIMDEIEAYLITLQQLTINPKLKDYLHELERTPVMDRTSKGYLASKDYLANLGREPVDGVPVQAHQVEELLKDLEHMLYLISRYIQIARVSIPAYPDKWVQTVPDLTLAIDQKFGGEMGELRAEFKLVLYKEEELRRLVSNDKHLAEFLA